jgi:hypothetical protein
MTEAQRTIGTIAITLLLGVAILVLFIVEPVPMLRGWLAGFVWVTMVPAGSLFLLMIHRLTGGEWGDALMPVIEPAARAILPAAALALPILIFSGSLYRWSDPEMPAVVAQFYMNAPLYAVRTLIAFVLWSLFAWLPATRSTAFRAAIVLIALAVITNIVPVDWIVSAQPGFYSSAFGFGFCIEQMLASLALCAILGPQGEDRRECRDLSGLLITVLLGWIYFFYMQFVIIWYGNLPEETSWYVIRGASPWPEIGGFAFAAGGVLPFLALLSRDVRESERLLRIAGAGIFLGIALHAIWLVVPSFGIAVLGPAVLSLAFMGMLFAIWLTRAGLRLAPPAQRHPATVVRHG